MSVTVVFCDPANVTTQRRMLHSRFVGQASTLEHRLIDAMSTTVEAANQFPDWLSQGCCFDVEFSAVQIPFTAMAMHVECGGSCIALRHGRMYSVFDVRGAPNFDWMWPDVEIYLLHSVEVMLWRTQETEIRARIARDMENRKRLTKV